ncbi:putative ABC transporter permease subunit [Butyrivibrio sp. VCB2006]|uniref:putative ABC transporter permease subunit n=1 Tax=Butyrivibrio sp. VCB2006 TaxID=1280679 RepID=UPI0004019B75|nr:hypothetical protein [Butyrivibrio sp. VCB2006]
MKNNILLLKTLLLSTSQINIYKHCNDKKKKRKVRAALIGKACLFAMLIGYSFAACAGYCAAGLTDSIPVLCALTISMLALLFTFFKTNGYLFNFKEYDMLMALPFEAKTVAGCKFLYMYVKSLPWYMSISVAMMAGYGLNAKPAAYVYVIWLILSLFVPIIPMLISAFFGFLIAKVSTGFKKTNLIQTVLTFIFVLFCFSFRYIVEMIFREDKLQDTLEAASEMTNRFADVYFLAGWFTKAITESSLSSAFLLMGVSLALFVAIFTVVGKSYRSINSALKSHAAAKNYKMTGQKKHSVVSAIAYKEFRRMAGSTTYITNVSMGELLAVILGVFTLIFGFDKIVGVVTQNAPFDYAIVHPAIPFIVYFCIGMVASTACSPSLEGKQYWIMQSLPIEKKTIYQGKMLFNMYLTVPFMAFGVLCLCISAHVPVVNTILYLILGVALCAFSTTWGCVCGIKHMRLDWENEVEVIKQGSAVAIYMLPNMFVVMALVVGVVFLGIVVDHRLLAIIFIVIVAALSYICYIRALALAKRT